MKKYFDLLKLHSHDIFIGVLFLIAGAVILFILPREGQFKYEYQRGRPWMHETLIAPFNFPIYKTEAELAHERDSALVNFRQYFLYDELVFDSVIVNYKEYLQSSWNKFISDKYEIPVNDVDQFVNENSSLTDLIDGFKKYSETALSSIYNSGILSPGEVTEQITVNAESLVIFKNNIGERVPFEKVYRLITAYERISQSVDSFLIAENSRYNSDLTNFFRTIEFNDFLVPNLFHDSEMTEMVRQSLLDEISLARGMVQTGERIVSRGDLITNDIFQILESLRREYQSRLGEANINYILIGQFIIVFSLIILLYLFLYNFRSNILESTRKTLFILFMVFLMIMVHMVVSKFSEVNIYVVPFAVIPIIITSFYDQRLALFLHTIILLLVGFFVPNSFEFVFLNFTIGVTAIFTLTNLYRRSKLFLTALIIVLSYSVLYFAIAIIQERSINNIDFINFAWFGLNGLLVLSTYPLLYIFEKSFGFLSDSTLMELSDTNQPLLRKLSEEAPGTFQHSMQVANLSEAAVNEIGGNPLLVRTGALYHDIGKIANPLYFIENQNPGHNPHDDHSYEESAGIIISHVTKGVELGKKYKLPNDIIDFIRTHHGTTRVQYFYKSFLNENPGREVDESKYTYPGPKPYSTETAVLMMADSVEAASRSLKDIDGESIDKLVDSIIDNQLNEQQFTDTPINYRDITKIKELFKKKLRIIYHARVAYPK